MRVIAVDPSMTCTGVWIDPDRSIKLTAPKGDRFDRLAWYQLQLAEIMDETRNRCDVFAIEGYAYNMSNSRAVTVMAELGGIIRAMARLNEYPIVEVSPISWKSHVFGRHMVRIKKRTAAERVLYLSIIERTFNKTFMTTDEADAYCIARYVHDVVNDQAGNTGAARELRNYLRDALDLEPVGGLFG